MDLASNAALVLESGDYFLGKAVGLKKNVEGVLCFTTAITGYQEAITDPSYAGQLLVFTFPHIGNVGTNEQDWESTTPALNGIIIGNTITPPSNYRSQLAFNDWLCEKKISGIAGVNTRLLVKIIRESSKPLKAVMHSLRGELSDSLVKVLRQQASNASSLETRYVEKLSNSYHHNSLTPHTPKLLKEAKRIVVLDYGLKASILRTLEKNNCEAFILPATASLEEILSLSPQGVVLSNGPGDPRSYDKIFTPLINSLVELDIPILAICFGYQLLALALGAKIKKLTCGHHGINHPVQSLKDSKILITSQNHEFTVEESSLPSHVLPTFRSLFDRSLEGFEVEEKPIIAVQFHPEANPGPSDATFLFNNFIELINAKTY